VKTAAFDANRNHTRALRRRRFPRAGPIDWGTVRGTVGAIAAPFAQKTERKQKKATVSLTAAFFNESGGTPVKCRERRRSTR